MIEERKINMKRFRNFWVNTGEPRRDIATLMVLATILGVAYPWISKGVEICIPFVVRYYNWVERF